MADSAEGEDVTKTEDTHDTGMEVGTGEKVWGTGECSFCGIGFC